MSVKSSCLTSNKGFFQIFYLCRGDELRRVEICSKALLRHSNSNNRLWHTILSYHGIKIHYSHEIPYKQLYILFKVNVYHLPRVKWMPKSLFTFCYMNGYHKNPKNFSSACPCDSCINNEAKQVKVLFNAYGTHSWFKNLFNSLHRGMRGKYNQTGERILYCSDCGKDVNLSHGVRQRAKSADHGRDFPMM